jgi:charged multivesicular body protein 7
MAVENKHLPPDWQDEDRMNFMFSAFPEHRHVNPKHWDSKLQFWRKLILENCNHDHELCVDFDTLRRRFTRNGLPPLGLQTVLKEMLKSGELQTFDSVTSGINNSWLSWGFDLAKKSVSWTVGSLIWGNDAKIDGTELFIVSDILKVRGIMMDITLILVIDVEVRYSDVRSNLFEITGIPTGSTNMQITRMGK